MNKKFIATLALAGIVLSSTGFAQAAEAPKADKEKAENSAQVDVLPGDDEKTDPIDPTDPTDPTGQKGKLTVDGIINFKFEEVKLKSTMFATGLKAKDAAENGKTNARSVQITDKRGTGEGWKLRLKQSEMRNYSIADQNSNKAVLKGAYISLPLLDTEETIFSTANNPSPAPKNLNYKFEAYNKFTDVAMAAKDTGMGSWVFKYNTTDKNPIELNIPGGNYAGAYEGIMTWSIVPIDHQDAAK